MPGVALLETAACGMDQMLDFLQKGQEQQNVPRREAVSVINQMCDALQAGVDVVSHEITAAALEFSELSRQRMDAAVPSPGGLLQRVNGFLARTAVRFSEPALRMKFHEGRVCNEMHVLGDRLSGPLGAAGTSPAWEVARALFTRSTSLGAAVRSLTEGEQQYLREFVWALDAVRQRAESAAGQWADEAASWREAEAVVAELRQKRAELGRQAAALRERADAVIGLLH